MDTYLIEANCYEKLAETYEKYGSLIIAVDFDDTIFDFHKKGRRYDDVINLLKRWQNRSKIVIWTNSPEDRYPFIEGYCEAVGLKIFGVNKDVVPEMAGRKIYANIYLDDHGGLPSSYRILKQLIDRIEENELRQKYININNFNKKMKPEILNDIYKHEVFPLFCSELFGADNNLTKEMCEKNLAKLKEIKEALPNSEVPKTMWHFVEDGIRILERDIYGFGVESSGKYEFDVEKTTKECIEWIQKWFDENGKDCNAIIGISGGKDSTVTAALCVEALGRDRVIGVMMPNSVQSDIDDSIKVVKHLGIAEKSMTINIGTTVNALSMDLRVAMGQSLSEQTTTNMPARVRMTVLYAVAQTMNGRVANTCNLSEDICGYCTFGGDNMGAFAPLSKLTTEEIMQIGDYLGLPYELAHKTPSDGLQSKTDEDNLGFTYHEINELARKGEKGEHFEEIMAKYEKNKFKTDIIRIPSFDPGLPNCIG